MEIPLWHDDAPYAKGSTEEDIPALIPYLLDGENNSVVIVCPGGGYARRANHEGEPIAKWLNSIGISAFVLRYRVAPYQYPCALLDAQRAIRTVRYKEKEYGIDPMKIGILGFSAGGHVAATASTKFDYGNQMSEDPIEQQSCRTNLSVLCYPVITLKEGFGHAGSRSNLLGENPNSTQIHELSLEENVTPETPPTFLWHTSNDASVPVENSLLFALALRKNNVLFDLHVYEEGRHGLGLALEDDHVHSWTNTCTSWLKQNKFV
ncbi:alpha/beta hydrolase [Evansella sp. AB-rgal1]|uniref:alpha/beta hydrolase n=1 Tax=Evansella sp. AB-rgal1 TaxID=3242696 RepID=UPI00359E4197